MPQISIDLSFITNFISQLASQPTPLHTAWFIFKSGGWLPFIYFFGYATFAIYMINIQTKWARKQKYVVLAIKVPKSNEQSPKAVENIFAHLYGTKASIDVKEKYVKGKFQVTTSFEIVSQGGDVQFFIRIHNKYRDLIEAAVYSQYPDVEITETEDYAKKFPRVFPNEKYELFGCDFQLERPFYYPIRTYPQFEHTLTGEFKDPMSLILETFANLKKDEVLAIQILATASSDNWYKEGEKAVQKMIGKAPAEKKGIGGALMDLTHNFFTYALTGTMIEEKKAEGDPFKMFNISPGERRIIESVEMKLSKVGFPCKIRYIHFAPHEIFANKYAVVKGFLKQFAILGCNGFGSVLATLPKKNFWYHRMARPYKQMRLISAFCSRDWEPGGPRYILNIEELATLWHFPVIEVKAPQVSKSEAKRGEPPRGLPIR